MKLNPLIYKACDAQKLCDWFPPPTIGGFKSYKGMARQLLEAQRQPIKFLSRLNFIDSVADYLVFELPIPEERSEASPRNSAKHREQFQKFFVVQGHERVVPGNHTADARVGNVNRRYNFVLTWRNKDRPIPKWVKYKS